MNMNSKLFYYDEQNFPVACGKQSLLTYIIEYDSKSMYRFRYMQLDFTKFVLKVKLKPHHNTRVINSKFIFLLKLYMLTFCMLRT